MLHEQGFCIGEYVNAYITDWNGKMKEYYLILNEANSLDPNEVDEIKDILIHGLLNDIDRTSIMSMLEEKNFTSLEFGGTLLESTRGI